MSAPGDNTTSWPISLELPVQWGEMDALGHVNNIVYLRWFETARMAYFRRCRALDLVEERGIGPILATTRVDFKIPVTYPDTVTVATRTERVGNSSFTMSYRVTSKAAGGSVAATGEGVIVMVEYEAGKAVPLSDAMRDKIRTLEAGAS